MKKRHLKKSVALLAVAGFLAAACGGSDGDSTSDTEAPVESDAPAETDPPAEEPEEEAPTNAEDVEEGDVAEGDVDTTVAETEETVNYGGDLTVGLEAEAVGLRPWEDTCSSPCYNIMNTVYDKLIERTADGVYGGFLAESITPNEDFTVWTMTLRPGVKFHNGVDLTAQSIADMFPIQQTGSVSAGQISASNLATVEASGDLEVTYTLSKPNSAFPAFLERAGLGMVFEAGAAAADSDGFSAAPVGTGPFVIESRDVDNATKVVRNDAYWGTDPEGNKLPYLDSVTFQPIPDEGNRLDSLISGTVDAINTLRQSTIRDARAAGGLTLFEAQGNNVGGGMFNLLVAPFDDLRVRKGLTQLNDQEGVIEALGGTGISLPGTQLFSPDSPWYSQAVADAFPKFNFEEGVALLTEYVNDPARSDGKAVGEKIDVELSCPPDPSLIAAMQVIEQVWTASELVNVTLTQFDQPTHISNAVGDLHKAHCWRFSDDNDPSVYVTSFLAPPTAEIAAAAGIPDVVSAINWPNWFNADAFGAAVAATQTDDFDERYALYETVGLKIAEEVPMWFSGHTATMIGAAENVTGFVSWHLPDGSLGSGVPSAEGKYAEVFFIS